MIAGLPTGADPTVEITVDVADDTPPVLADSGLLERVLENVISNAVRYAPGAIEILVAAVPDESEVVELSVVDHGRGVPPVERDTMFREFQRLDDRGVGVGLGLAVAQGFVESMGGSLTPSDTPGGGLTMSIILPIAQPIA